MLLTKTLRSEIKKTKRTSIWYFGLLAAAIIPAIILIEFGNGTVEIENYINDPWNSIFMAGLTIQAFLFLPLYVILACSLLVQLEFRNNTWKQVFSSPQSKINLFLSKFLLLQFFLLFSILTYNLLMVLAIVIVNLIEPSYEIYNSSLNLNIFFPVFGKLYLSMAAISAIQLWLGIRFKNFLLPVGIGFVLVIAGGLAATDFNWDYAKYFPYAYSMMIMGNKIASDQLMLGSLLYMLVFLLIGYYDFRKSGRMIGQ